MTHWTYPWIMLAAIGTGAVLLARGRRPLDLAGRQLALLALGGFVGGMIGAKLPFLLSDWPRFLSGEAWLDHGKTILTGLVGGYLGVLYMEWALEIRTKSCDMFAVPLAAAIGVGRWACFAAGCCHGTPTSLPWGVDFGDGVACHPTQVYESAFHLSAAVVLSRLQRDSRYEGQLIRLYLLAYMVYRFATEFIRPEPAIFLGLTGYQLATLVLAPFFAFWCCPACRIKPRPVVAHPAAGGEGRMESDWQCGARDQRSRLYGGAASPVTIGQDRTELKQTTTVCPACLEPVPGTVYQESGKVFLERICPTHGATLALVSSDRRHYYLRDEVPHKPPQESCCGGPGPMHPTCVAVLEVTEACNLQCPVCFASSPRGGHRRYEDLCADIDAFLAARGKLDVIQLSGGEPLLHPDLLRLVDFCRTRPIEFVMINTNGLELARDPSLAAELARRMPRLEIYWQLDGLDAAVHRTLRGEDLSERKQAVLETLLAHKLPVTTVATLVRGVNEDQVGKLLRLGLDSPIIRGVTFQPATICGRYTGRHDPLGRLTQADVIRLVIQQSEGLFVEDDFQPLPCSNPNCCTFTYVARKGRPSLIPLGRIFRYEDHVEQLADRLTFQIDTARQCCGIGRRPEDFFRVFVKPFMDAWSYDQDRIDECCVHMLRPGGRAVSFCRFNILERGRLEP